ncbi:MAG: helix-turn-helix domain-containing protein [Nocardioides sp.]|uniref:IclR family transcriptional regulator n=1 Tax=Nocardioides sp. TaxID=35761 RepID=UPI0039E26918
MSTLQTLDRGIRALVIVSGRPGGMSVADLAGELGVARSICYRIVSTFISHGLLTRSADGRVFLGAAVPALAASYWPSFLSLVTPTLHELADRTGATAFLSVAEGEDAVAVLSIDPAAAPMIRIGYRVGSRHPLTQGAAGIAILAGRPAAPDEPEDVAVARARRYSITRGQLQPGAVGVAAPIPRTGTGPNAPEAALGVVALDGFDAEAAAVVVLQAAHSLGE